MESESNCPEWLSRARALWPSGGAPAGLDKNWSPKWIKRFLVYLEKRNRGELPQDLPDYRILDSFERFMRQSWKLEDWQVEQARRAVDWLMDVAGSHEAEPEAGEMPAKEPVELAAVCGETALPGSTYFPSAAQAFIWAMFLTRMACCSGSLPLDFKYTAMSLS